MRIALIILSILSLVFIGTISWSLVSQDKWSLHIPSLSSKTASPESVDNITLETWKNQVKTDAKLERLTALVEEMAKKNGTYNPESIGPTSTGSTIKTEIQVIKPSGKLLALLMPTITPELDKNSGIYGLYIFDTNVTYTTYRDAAIPLTFITMGTPYDTFLKNIKSLGGKPYTINEIKTFPFRACFINSETPDALVRLIVEIESQTVAFEVPKARYELLKNLLLGKGGTNIKSLTQTVSSSTGTLKTNLPKTQTSSIAPLNFSSGNISTGTTSKTSTTRTGTTIRIIQ